MNPRYARYPPNNSVTSSGIGTTDATTNNAKRIAYKATGESRGNKISAKRISIKLTHLYVAAQFERLSSPLTA